MTLGYRVRVAALFVVGLTLGVGGSWLWLKRYWAGRGVGAQREAPLYVPCLASSLPDLASGPHPKNGPCAGGTLSVQRDDKNLSLSLKGLPVRGLAGRMPELAASLLPNLPDPTFSRLLPGRRVLRLDLRGAPDDAGRTMAAIRAYHDAELRVESYEAMGGHRLARWELHGARIDVEDAVTPDGAAVVVRYFEGESKTEQPGGSGAELGTPASWKGPWKTRGDPPYVVDLRTSLLAMGWWYDDADALLSAALAAGVEPGPDTARALRVVGEWLRTSGQWDVSTRAAIYSECITKRLSSSGSGATRQRYDQLAGVWADARVLAEPPSYAGREEEAAAYGRVFTASIGSAAHAYCAIAMADPLVDAPEESPQNRVLRRAEDPARVLALELLKSAKFLAAVGSELVRVRSSLLEPGAPDL